MTTLQLYRDRTDWRPASATPAPVVHGATGGDSLGDGSNLWATRLLFAPLIIGLGGTGSLLNNAQIAVLTRQATAAPVLDWPQSGDLIPSEAPLNLSIQTEGQRLCQELRDISGLTNEEIAPLLSVSRRSFQTWLAGGAISARKESHLRSVVSAVRSLAGADRAQTRARLLHRDKHAVSVFDLLQERRFDAAVDLALGQWTSTSRSRHGVAESLAVQLDRDQGSIPRVNSRLNNRLSKPIRR